MENKLTSRGDVHPNTVRRFDFGGRRAASSCGEGRARGSRDVSPAAGNRRHCLAGRSGIRELPFWSDDHTLSVAEIIDGKLKPFLMTPGTLRVVRRESLLDLRSERGCG